MTELIPHRFAAKSSGIKSKLIMTAGTTLVAMLLLVLMALVNEPLAQEADAAFVYPSACGVYVSCEVLK